MITRFEGKCHQCRAALPVGSSVRYYGHGVIYGTTCHTQIPAKRVFASIDNAQIPALNLFPVGGIRSAVQRFGLGIDRASAAILHAWIANNGKMRHAVKVAEEIGRIRVQTTRILPWERRYPLTAPNAAGGRKPVMRWSPVTFDNDIEYARALQSWNRAVGAETLALAA